MRVDSLVFAKVNKKIEEMTAKGYTYVVDGNTIKFVKENEK